MADVNNQVEEFVINGSELLYAEDSREGIMSILETSKDPAEGIGNVALMIVQKLETSLGGQVSDEVLLAGAVRLVEEIAGFGEEAGLFQADENMIQLALAYAVQEYIKGGLAKGKYTQEELMQSVQVLEAEDQTGQATEEPPVEEVAPEQERRGLLNG